MYKLLTNFHSNDICYMLIKHSKHTLLNNTRYRKTTGFREDAKKSRFTVPHCVRTRHIKKRSGEEKKPLGDYKSNDRREKVRTGGDQV